MSGIDDDGVLISRGRGAICKLWKDDEGGETERVTSFSAQQVDAVELNGLYGRNCWLIGTHISMGEPFTPHPSRISMMPVSAKCSFYFLKPESRRLFLN